MTHKWVTRVSIEVSREHVKTGAVCRPRPRLRLMHVLLQQRTTDEVLVVKHARFGDKFFSMLSRPKLMIITKPIARSGIIHVDC